MQVEAIPTTVYLAPTKGRRYLSKQSAAKAEASALLERKYPSEHGDGTDGLHGWHWSHDPRLCRLHARLVKIICNRQQGSTLAAERRQERAERERLLGICVSAHGRLLRGDSGAELLEVLEQAWENPATNKIAVKNNQLLTETQEGHDA